MSTFNADQLVAHAVGDYLIQSDWMANEKTKSNVAAAAHACSYALPFLFLRPSKPALAIIVGTHFLIDRFRLARFVCWAKNQPAPMEDRTLTATGYPADRPAWMSVWLLIIADNICHVILNGWAMARWRSRSARV